MTAKPIEGDNTYVKIDIAGVVSYNVWFSQTGYVALMKYQYGWDEQRAEINFARHLRFAPAQSNMGGSSVLSYRRYNERQEVEILLRVA